MQRLPAYYLPIDKNGRVVIPKPIRDALGFSSAGFVRATVTDNKIIMESGRAVCKFCGNGSILCEDFPICSECLEKINSFIGLNSGNINKKNG